MQCIHEIEEPTCGVCRPRPGTPAVPRAGSGWLRARYRGRCSGCEEPIEPGDQIRSDSEDGWLCAGCGAEAVL